MKGLVIYWLAGMGERLASPERSNGLCLLSPSKYLVKYERKNKSVEKEKYQ